jgi:hypothetical protein
MCMVIASLVSRSVFFVGKPETLTPGKAGTYALHPVEVRSYTTVKVVIGFSFDMAACRRMLPRCTGR